MTPRVPDIRRFLTPEECQKISTALHNQATLVRAGAAAAAASSGATVLREQREKMWTLATELERIAGEFVEFASSGATLQIAVAVDDEWLNRPPPGPLMVSFRGMKIQIGGHPPMGAAYDSSSVQAASSVGSCS